MKIKFVLKSFKFKLLATNLKTNIVDTLAFGSGESAC